MHNQNTNSERLATLVAEVGGSRKAALAIKYSRGDSPSKSTIDRACKGRSQEYLVLCMIEDLKRVIDETVMTQIHEKDSYQG